MTNKRIISAKQELLEHIGRVVRRDCYAAFNMKTGKGYQRVTGSITDGVLMAHLNGTQPIAVYPITGDETSVAVLDIDVHAGELSWEETKEAARPIFLSLLEAGYTPLAFRSGGGKGIHIWILFREPQKAKKVRAVLLSILTAHGLKEGTEGIALGEVEIYPRQDSVKIGGYGNAIALPLARKSEPIDLALHTSNMKEDVPTVSGPVLSPNVPSVQPSGTDEVAPLEVERPLPNAVLEGDDIEARSALEHIPADGYDTWIRVGYGLKSAFGDGGFELWDEWSQSSQKYPSREEARKKWESFPSKSSVGIGTIFFLAQENGWNGPSDPKIREMNAMYGHLTHKNASQVILKIDSQTGAEPYQFLSRETFRDRLRSEFIETEGPDGKSKVVPLADYWLGHSKRSQFHNVIFNPALSPGEAGMDWNVWSGFGVEPNPSGSWELLKRHILEIICGGDLTLYNWLLNWMARGVQYPGEVIGTAPLLLGPPGTGKGILANAYGTLWGRHFTTVTQREQVTGRFSGHLFGKRFVFLDEAMFGGDRKDSGVIKTRITEPHILIEQKGVDASLVENRMIFMAASNEANAVAVDIGDRRWQVFNVNPARREDRGYFGAIVRELMNGGHEAMLHELLHRDLAEGPDPRTTIKTEGLFDQLLVSQMPEVRYLYHVLQTGSLPQQNMPGNGHDRTTVGAMLLDLKHFERAAHVSRESLGALISKAIKGVQKQQNGTVLLRPGNQYEPDEVGRSTRYIFPPLAEARRQFENYLNMPIDWSEPEAEWDRSYEQYKDMPF